MTNPYEIRNEREQQLMAVAAAQEALICRADVKAVGFSRRLVAQREESGRWIPVAPGVWRIAGSPVTWRQQLRAGLLWLGIDAVVCGLAAAALWVFDRFPEGPIEFLVPRSGRGRASGPFEVHSTLTLPPIDTATAQGFRVTSASRTVIDLAARQVTPVRLGAAIDSAVRDGLSSPVYLAKRIADLRGPGRAGVRLLDELMVDAGGHTRLERRFLEIVRTHGLPRPLCQVIHRRDGTTVARVDFDFQPAPLIVEVSGKRGHVTEEDRLRDASRRNELQAAGFMVIEFLSSQVYKDPGFVANEVRDALALMSRQSALVSAIL